MAIRYSDSGDRGLIAVSRLRRRYSRRIGPVRRVVFCPNDYLVADDDRCPRFHAGQCARVPTNYMRRLAPVRRGNRANRYIQITQDADSPKAAKATQCNAATSTKIPRHHVTGGTQSSCLLRKPPVALLKSKTLSIDFADDDRQTVPFFFVKNDFDVIGSIGPQAQVLA